jgi:hypothetical protein
VIKMKIKTTLFVSLLFISSPVLAQVVVGNGYVQYVWTAPSGSCGQNAQASFVVGLGTLYTCQSGTWTQISGGGSLPAGLTFSVPTLTVSAAGSGNGVLALSGNTSGTATLTAPAIAGTAGNPVTFSNVINLPAGVNSLPQIGLSGNANYGFSVDSSGNFFYTAGGAQEFSVTTAGQASVPNGSLNAKGFGTATNCSSSASPAVCGSAAAGSVALPTGTNPTLQVNTTAVTANSQIMLTVDESLGTKLSVTCNTTLSTLLNPVVTGRSTGVSFTFTIGAVIASNPACVSYTLSN